MQYKRLGSKFEKDWKKFPKFKVQVQLRYDSKSINCSNGSNEDCVDALETFGVVEITFNVLHMAILMRKNHILDLLLQQKEKCPTEKDFNELVDIYYEGFYKNPAKSWISAANALHLASKFNPKALYIILSKLQLQKKNDLQRKSFWESSTIKFGFSPPHSAATNPDDLSTR